MTSNQRAIATSAIHLMQGVVYQESDDWADLQRHRGALRDHFAVVGLDVVINEDEGFAYLRTKDTPDGEDPLPRVIRRHALTYADSLLAVLLRKRRVEFESSGDQGKLVLSTEQIVEMLELPEHPFFLATQAHPEFNSRPNHPHPLFSGFVAACLRAQP